MKYYSGMDYLRIDIASQFGLDKRSFEERIQWVHDNEGSLDLKEVEAEDYYRYASAVKAYRRAQQGLPVGHMVGLDACASGPQVLSAIIGCKAGAINTGLIGKKRQDVYGAVTDAMNKHLENRVVYPRKEIKSALMPYFYGSKAQPKKVFGKGTAELVAFHKAAEEVCPGAAKLLPLMLQIWDPDALSYSWNLPDGFQVKYFVKDKVDTKIEVDTLDNHPTFVYRREVNTTLEKASTLPANVTHSIDAYVVRELVTRCNYTPGHVRSIKLLLQKQLDSGTQIGDCLDIEKTWIKHGIMSMAGVDKITPINIKQLSKEYCQALLGLIEVVLNRPTFEVVTVHDEFKCHPNFMNYVRQTYIELFMELADSSTLNAILSDITGGAVRIKKLSKSLSTSIRKSECALS